MIVKVQLPIWTSSGEDLALIYNEDRSIEHLATEEETAQIREVQKDLKKFWHAHMNDDGLLQLDDFAPDQKW